MKSSLLIKVGLLLLLAVFILAPFTFLKAQITKATLEEPSAETLVKNESVEPINKASGKNIAVKKVAVKKTPEKPLHDVILPNFTAIEDINAKKKRFFDFMKPSVNKQNDLLLAQRAKLKAWLERVTLSLPLSEQEQQELALLTTKYQVNNQASILAQLNELLLRVDIIPMPLVLVQAANESAWGTSRFSRIGLNFFGIWCYKPGCGMVPSGRNMGAEHEVAAFKSLEGAVARYFRNINTNKAYRVFRTIRADLRAQKQTLSPEILATGLLPYSERGVDYVIDINNMLRHNQHYLTEKTPKQQIIVAE